MVFQNPWGTPARKIVQFHGCARPLTSQYDGVVLASRTSQQPEWHSEVSLPFTPTQSPWPTTTQNSVLASASPVGPLTETGSLRLKKVGNGFQRSTMVPFKNRLHPNEAIGIPEQRFLRVAAPVA